MDITYRPFAIEDKAFLIDSILALYHEDGTGDKMNLQKIENSIAFFKEQPDLGEILMIGTAEEAVGYCIITIYWSNEYGGRVVLIDELFIDAVHRGKGFGSLFLKKLVSDNRRNAVMYELEVLPDNPTVIGFYENSGFKNYQRTHLRLVL